MGASFIHTADWQIGRIFASMGGEAAVILKRERIKTVHRIAQLATERSVDAVLVAGDVFENNLVTNETIHAVIHAMEAFKGPWVLVPGNHDPAMAESVWRRLELIGCPDNIHVATEQTQFILADGRLGVLAAALRRKNEIEDLTAPWDAIETPQGAVRVGLAHGSVEGVLPGECESTNRIAADRSTRARLDYLALGDWHGTYKVGENTFYSGTPEPDRFRNNDSGNVLHVSCSSPKAKPEIAYVRVAGHTWSELEIAVCQETDLGALDALLLALGEPFDGHVVKLTIQGTVDLKTRNQLDYLLTKWRGRLTWLGEDLTGLVEQPTDEDFDRIDTTGFVRTAMERLRAMQKDSSVPERKLAIGALRLLYHIHIAGTDTK